MTTNFHPKLNHMRSLTMGVWTWTLRPPGNWTLSTPDAPLVAQPPTPQQPSKQAPAIAATSPTHTRQTNIHFEQTIQSTQNIFGSAPSTPMAAPYAPSRRVGRHRQEHRQHDEQKHCLHKNNNRSNQHQQTWISSKQLTTHTCSSKYYKMDSKETFSLSRTHNVQSQQQADRHLLATFRIHKRHNSNLQLHKQQQVQKSSTSQRKTHTRISDNRYLKHHLGHMILRRWKQAFCQQRDLLKQCRLVSHKHRGTPTRVLSFTTTSQAGHQSKVCHVGPDLISKLHSCSKLWHQVLL